MTWPAPAPMTCNLWQGEDGWWYDAWDGIYLTDKEALRDLAGLDRNDHWMQPHPEPGTLWIKAWGLREGHMFDGEPLIGMVDSDNASLAHEYVSVEGVGFGREHLDGWCNCMATPDEVVIYTDNTATPLIVHRDTWVQVVDRIILV